MQDNKLTLNAKMGIMGKGGGFLPQKFIGIFPKYPNFEKN
jgi:hypothetical protein